MRQTEDRVCPRCETVFVVDSDYRERKYCSRANLVARETCTVPVPALGCLAMADTPHAADPPYGCGP